MPGPRRLRGRPVRDRAVHLARANLYRYVALGAGDPRDPRTAALLEPALQEVVLRAVRWLQADPRFGPEELGPGEIHPRELEEPGLFPRSLEELEAAYARVFGHTISKDCPPYEVEYVGNRDIHFRAQQLADIAGFYRAFGLDRAERSRDRVDHLSFEASFMEVLIARQLYAELHRVGRQRLRVCREAQVKFFAAHLGWWLPAFGARLEARAESGFYAALGRFLRAFAAAERAVLRLPPFDRPPDPGPAAAPSLGGCPGATGGAPLEPPPRRSG